MGRVKKSGEKTRRDITGLKTLYLLNPRSPTTGGDEKAKRSAGGRGVKRREGGEKKAGMNLAKKKTGKENHFQLSNNGGGEDEKQKDAMKLGGSWGRKVQDQKILQTASKGYPETTSRDKNPRKVRGKKKRVWQGKRSRKEYYGKKGDKGLHSGMIEEEAGQSGKDGKRPDLHLRAGQGGGNEDRFEEKTAIEEFHTEALFKTEVSKSHGLIRHTRIGRRR